MRAIAKTDGADCRLVYAGRADDPTLEPTLFDDLQMPRPDDYLGVDSTSLNEITSHVMAQFDAYLDSHPTDVVIVVDDLASTMAAAIVTKKRGVRLAHLVAGTRSFDIAMPKEINRLVIDALSDYLFTAGIKSNSVATREQGDTGQTYMVGNILMDNLRYNHDRLRKPDIEGIDAPYMVLTLNRKALLAEPKLLNDLLQELIHTGITIVAPLRSHAQEVVRSLCGDSPNMHIVSPLPYLEFGWLTAHAKGIVTDSGNVAEEATFWSVPCITLNSYTEHQETVTVGSNVLVDGDAQRLHLALETLLHGEWKHCALPDRWDGRSAERIVQIILSGD
jgi:UDP-N-acetylglucosamine 2-epimerase (non-hydrolysing)